MKILVTGHEGFIGKNLLLKLSEENIEYITHSKNDTHQDLRKKINSADFIVHLAGANRPENENEFQKNNVELTDEICNILRDLKSVIPIIFSSSTQIKNDNPYGNSKKKAEEKLLELSKLNTNTIMNYRLPNVFGKWCKPNYNSVVATFCHNIVNNLPINIHNKDVILNLVYIDDVISEFISKIKQKDLHDMKNFENYKVLPTYNISVGDLADQIYLFKESKKTQIIERVGKGLTRALYSTYLSYYSPEKFSHGLRENIDERGVFVEMLKTHDSGQFSFFSAHPGITRGGHYHHSKNEKFLVIKGNAKFCFRNIITDEFYELETNGEEPTIVETVPGWSHDITNIGNDEMLVMLWANEVFNQKEPDTYTHKV
jgi:UDP-2-acetamido-2,6-beta-L-arabino-hexul-4-ose reductase